MPSWVFSNGLSSQSATVSLLNGLPPKAWTASKTVNNNGDLFCSDMVKKVINTSVSAATEANVKSNAEVNFLQEYDNNFPSLPESQGPLTFGDVPSIFTPKMFVPTSRHKYLKKATSSSEYPARVVSKSRVNFRQKQLKQGSGYVSRVHHALQFQDFRTPASGTLSKPALPKPHVSVKTNRSVTANIPDKPGAGPLYKYSSTRTGRVYQTNIFSVFSSKRSHLNRSTIAVHDLPDADKTINFAVPNKSSYKYLIKFESCRPLSFHSKKASMTLAQLKRILRKNSNLTFSKCNYACRFLVNGHLLYDNCAIVHFSDTIEYLQPGLGGAPPVTTSDNQSKTPCAVCKGLTTPNLLVSLKNKTNPDTVASIMTKFNLNIDSVICRKCNMKLDREFQKNQQIKYQPKKKTEACFIFNCSKPGIHKKHYEDHYDNICSCFSISPAATTATAIYLCKKHYTVYHNFSTRTTSCDMCSLLVLRPERTRKCQPQHLVSAAEIYYQKHNVSKIFTESNKFCNSCYRSILRHERCSSTPDVKNLDELIKFFQEMIITHSTSNTDNFQNEKCFYEICILLATEFIVCFSIILSDLYNKYLLLTQEYALDESLCLSKPQFLNKLSYAFGTGLVVYTKVTVGTLLHWSETDPMESLLKCLVKKDRLEKTTKKTDNTQTLTDNNILLQASSLLREKLSYLRDKFINSNFDLRNINYMNVLDDIDKDLWEFITYITSSDRELVSKSYQKDKLLKRIYIISTILFTQDNQVRFPCHLLLAGVINKYTKSSSDCMHILNSFGACVSKKTFERFEKTISLDIQQVLLSFLGEEEPPFSVVSLDNFNDNQKYKAVWHGDGSRGFDGATFMVVQPAPLSIKAPADQKATSSHLQKYNYIGLNFASISFTTELYLALLISGSNQLASMYSKDSNTKDTKKKDFGDLLIKYASKIQPQVELHFDKKEYDHNKYDLIFLFCIAVLTDCPVLVFSSDDSGLLVCDVCVLPGRAKQNQGALFALAVNDKFKPLVPLSMLTKRLFSAIPGDLSSLKEQFEKVYLNLHSIHAVNIKSFLVRPSTSEIKNILQGYEEQASGAGSFHQEFYNNGTESVCQHLAQTHNDITALSVISANADEQNSIEALKSDIFLFFLQKNAAESLFIFLPDMKTFFRNFKSDTGSVERSNIIYVDLTNENPDSKTAVKALLDKVSSDLEIGIKLKYAIVEGDGLLFHHFYKLKEENPAYYSWLLPYPGDWHTLKNYASCLFKIYSPAGLKELVTKFHKGSTAASVLDAKDFDKTLSFLLQVYESLYRFQIKTFFKQRNSSGTDHSTESIESFLK